MAERLGVYHHMMDILSPSEVYSIADYQRDVRKCIDELVVCGKLPLLVGGSGLYIDAVIKDYRFEGAKRDDNVEARYQHLSDEELHQHLEQLDKNAASTIHPHNRKRVLRAFELESSPIAKDSRAYREDYYYNTLVIFLNDEREALYQRINQRVLQMIDAGLIEEVSSIGEDNFSLTSRVAIGYKECLSYLNGVISREIGSSIHIVDSFLILKWCLILYNRRGEKMKQRLPLLFAILCISSALMWGAFSCLSIEQKGESQEEVVSQIAPLAESAIVMDMRTTRVLYAYHEKKKMLPASITKILTCITCLEYYQLDDLVVVGKEVLQSEGSAIYLKIGDVISIRVLLYG